MWPTRSMRRSETLVRVVLLKDARITDRIRNGRGHKNCAFAASQLNRTNPRAGKAVSSQREVRGSQSDRLREVVQLQVLSRELLVPIEDDGLGVIAAMEIRAASSEVA